MFWRKLPIERIWSDTREFIIRYKKKFLFGTLLVSVFFSTFLISYALFSLSNVFVKNDAKVANSKIFEQPGLPTPNPNGQINVLLLGYGGAGHEGGGLSDVVMVANVNYKKNKITFISVPRDTWTELPVRSDKKEYYKINNAFAIGNDDNKYPLKEPLYKGSAGGGEMAKYAVGQVTGVPIDYFIAVDFNGFKKVIDDLGGVEINVPVSFEDFYYPIKGAENLSCGKSAQEIAELTNTLSGFELEKQFQCRYEHLRFEKGVTEMDGETALKFVRSRHSDTHGGDFARSQRQFAVLEGVKGKLFELDALSKWSELFDQFTKILTTDIDKDMLGKFFAENTDLDSYTLETIYLSTENVFNETKSPDGQYILIPKAGEGIFSEVHQFVADNLAKN